VRRWAAVIRDASLPDCPQCGTAIRQAERIGVSAAVEPCGHFIPAEFFKPSHVEASVDHELVADGGVVREEPVAPNRAAGEETERYVAAAVPELSLVPDDVVEWHDSIATGAIFPASDLPMVGLCVVARGTVVEIKSAKRRLPGQRRGRFYARPEQHDRLVAAGGVYVFAVVDESRAPLALKVVPATTFEALLPAWRSGGDGRSDHTQVAWSRLFDPAEVEGGESA
jgi:hypothetical protein